jgi:hypothetical protein
MDTANYYKANSSQTSASQSAWPATKYNIQSYSSYQQARSPIVTTLSSNQLPPQQSYEFISSTMRKEESQKNLS